MLFNHVCMTHSLVTPLLTLRAGADSAPPVGRWDECQPACDDGKDVKPAEPPHRCCAAAARADAPHAAVRAAQLHVELGAEAELVISALGHIPSSRLYIIRGQYTPAAGLFTRPTYWPTAGSRERRPAEYADCRMTSKSTVTLDVSDRGSRSDRVAGSVGLC